MAEKKVSNQNNTPIQETSQEYKLTFKDMLFGPIRGFVGEVAGLYMLFKNWYVSTNGDVIYHHTMPGGTDIHYQLNSTTNYNGIMHPIGVAVAAVSLADIAYSMYKIHKINKELSNLENLTQKIDGVTKDLTEKINGVNSYVTGDLTQKIDDVTDSLTKKIDNVNGNLTKKIDYVNNYVTGDLTQKIDDVNKNLDTVITNLSINIPEEKRKEIVEKIQGDKNGQ